MTVSSRAKSGHCDGQMTGSKAAAAQNRAFAKPYGFGDHDRGAHRKKNQGMDDEGANAPTQVSLPDDSGAKAVVSPARISPTSQEQTTPMLDVHSPHETVRSWKEFFTHIAIITIGLLIAIGLEQTVEHIHRIYQLNEARRELKIELEANRKQLEKNLVAAQQLVAQLDSDMALLRAAQASHSVIGQKLMYEVQFFWPLDGTWQAVKQNGSLALMPHNELYGYTYVHEAIAAVMEGLTDLGARLRVANAIYQRAPDGNFTPRDLEELISATSEVQGKAAFGIELLHYEDIGLKSVGN